MKVSLVKVSLVKVSEGLFKCNQDISMKVMRLMDKPLFKSILGPHVNLCYFP